MIGRRLRGLWNVSRLIHGTGRLQASLHHKRRKLARAGGADVRRPRGISQPPEKFRGRARKLTIRADALSLAFDVLDWTNTLEE